MYYYLFLFINIVHIYIYIYYDNYAIRTLEGYTFLQGIIITLEGIRAHACSSIFDIVSIAVLAFLVVVKCICKGPN